MMIKASIFKNGSYFEVMVNVINIVSLASKALLIFENNLLIPKGLRPIFAFFEVWVDNSG